MIKNLLKEFINLRKLSEVSGLNVENEELFVPSEELWMKFLRFIESDRITVKQIEEIITAMSRKNDVVFIKQIKETIENNCDYAEDIRKKHPKITPSELRICCYIVEGKSSAEIAALMKVEVSTVTSYRSRIRTKMGVRRGRSLKVYLDSISRLKRGHLQRLSESDFF